MMWACISKLQDPEQGIQIAINEQREAAVLDFLRGLKAAVIQLAEECHQGPQIAVRRRADSHLGQWRRWWRQNLAGLGGSAKACIWPSLPSAVPPPIEPF